MQILDSEVPLVATSQILLSLEMYERHPLNFFLPFLDPFTTLYMSVFHLVALVTKQMASMLAIAVVLVTAIVEQVLGAVSLKSLPVSLEVNASVVDSAGQSLNTSEAKAGRDRVEVTWVLKEGFEEEGAKYKRVAAKMCYSEKSQEDRSWRKANEDDLSRDKSCPFLLGSSEKTGKGSMVWTVADDTPKAFYFIRVYALNSEEALAGYGQTHSVGDDHLLVVEAISGRHKSLDIAAVLFSVLSVFTLLGFLMFEKWQNDKKKMQCK
eukprot:TRINITY_DN5832_c0_g1_i1.p1 TRINITY_DN5832_c0_g1~~TRINITY_DN5832_c0_g1_i1.p1  ORF type:complete len:266 (-),score=54.37 TRINITY_DN5832_c0_g1_i1:61-858(-)